MVRRATNNRTLIFEQLPGDYQALDFAGTFADGAELYVTIKLFGGIIFDEAVAAMNLDSFIGAPYGDFAGVKLRHRRLLGGFHAGILHGRGL